MQRPGDQNSTKMGPETSWDPGVELGDSIFEHIWTSWKCKLFFAGKIGETSPGTSSIIYNWGFIAGKSHQTWRISDVLLGYVPLFLVGYHTSRFLDRYLNDTPAVGAGRDSLEQSVFKTLSQLTTPPISYNTCDIMRVYIWYVYIYIYIRTVYIYIK